MTSKMQRAPLCPICRKFMKNPVVKCAHGQRVCSTCVTSPTISCAFCKSLVTKPLLFEKPASSLIADKFKCKYFRRGCKYLLDSKETTDHHSECRFRDFVCEGHSFNCWTCDWTGRYDQIPEHFGAEHEDNVMFFKTEAVLQLNLKEEFRSISLIDYRDGQNFFWYKCKVDLKKKRFYAAVQMIGTKKLSENYFFEFEIFSGPVKKIKVTETCQSNAIDVESIFEKENCVALSFKTLKNYLDEKGMLRFRFRIMSIKKTLD